MKKNLLHITLSMGFGGLEHLVYQLIINKPNDLYNIFLCCLDRGGYFFEKLNNENVKTFILNRKRCKVDFALIRNLSLLIRKHKIDIIHSHSGTIFYSALSGKLANAKKIIHTEHGRYLPDDLIEIWEDRICSRFVNKYVVVSKALEVYTEKVLKVKKDKVLLITNGVENNKYYKYEDQNKIALRGKYNLLSTDIIIGVVSRLVPEKNILFLINWFRTILEDHLSLKLVIVGDGMEMRNLKNTAQNIPPDKLQFWGEKDDIPDILNVFDIFVLPSLTEGTSMTILEAMATELPVIASDVGNNSTLISDGENGFLFEANNMESFNRKIEILIENKELREEMGGKGRKKIIDHFNIDKMINKYYKLYKD